MTEKEHLLFKDVEEVFSNTHEMWIDLHFEMHQEENNLVYFTALAPKELSDKLLNRHEWDVYQDSFLPCRSTSYDGNGNVKEKKYLSFGNTKGFEPLIIRRLEPRTGLLHFDISQELIMFLGLYEDTAKNEFYRYDSAGEKETVIRFEGGAYKIRKDLLLKFCRVKGMCAVTYVDGSRYSTSPLSQFSEEKIWGEKRGKNFYIKHILTDDQYCDYEGIETVAHVMGKRVLVPSNKPEEDETEKFHEFIVGNDEDGNPIKIQCDPNAIHCDYLTPVFFKRDVLQRYYGENEKYSVEDGIIRCGSFWSLQIDNNNSDYVVVFLGDLARDLPEKEREYWLNYNIPPMGKKMSQTTFRRSFEGDWADPLAYDLLFKSKYGEFVQAFRKKHGWDFFLPFHKDDRHFFDGLRLLANDNQTEFDGQILALTKILIDSINEAEITAKLENPPQGSISKLEAYFTELGVDDFEDHIEFLRLIQNIRSSSTAHRKGGNYEKMVRKLPEGIDKKEQFSGFLQQACSLIDFLEQAFC